MDPLEAILGGSIKAIPDSKRMTARYSNFKMNNEFHALRKPLLENEKYAKIRYLDLENKVGPKKPYFNANILQVFDLSYTKINA